jgi:hypothetical protein
MLIVCERRDGNQIQVGNNWVNLVIRSEKKIVELSKTP